ncbi:maestro heat-like repeat family member 5 [Podarcis lilfordi]|uniref:Maestro heat-like repeat family member 5 n=1 Tax=Podarcis lilfordi TaxID=74358 RepID=A0AA35KVE6_9SAUR|nr:maestro heat-like repeat family member 5 [Podarcis lilfordi]
MTALALVIEFLKSPSAVKMMNRFSLRDHLEEGSAAANPIIKELCLKGLGSFVFQPAKVKVLREELPTLIGSVFSGHEQDILQGLQDITTAIYEMDGQRIGPLCMDLALNVRSFLKMEGERGPVRAASISLFGQLVMKAKEADKPLLRKEVLYSLLSLLLHLKDRDGTVAMSCKLTLLHCGVFLGWAHLKLMFRSLAWDDSRNCVVNVWKYLMRNHHDDIHVFISQALGYLHHPQVEISHAAARFTGHTLNYYSSELSKNLEQEDIVYLNKVFQEFESSPDPIMVHFAKTYRVVLQKLSVKRRLSGAGEKSTPETKGSSAGKLLSECDSRAPSPMLLPPESPTPRPPLLEGTAFLGLESPRRAKRSITQRGKQPTEWTVDHKGCLQMLCLEAPAAEGGPPTLCTKDPPKGPGCCRPQVTAGLLHDAPESRPGSCHCPWSIVTSWTLLDCRRPPSTLTYQLGDRPGQALKGAPSLTPVREGSKGREVGLLTMDLHLPYLGNAFGAEQGFANSALSPHGSSCCGRAASYSSGTQVSFPVAPATSRTKAPPQRAAAFTAWGGSLLGAVGRMRASLSLHCFPETLPNRKRYEPLKTNLAGNS